jgi:16S rRNA (guanine527-N7)-methyltransferase
LPQTDTAGSVRTHLDRLLAEAPSVQRAVSPAIAERVTAFAALLLDANERLNLTRVTDPEAVARDHLLDALAALPLLERIEPRIAIDLGSGGGVSAIPLAIALPDVRWTLVESTGRKAEALRSFAQALELENVEVLADRAEVIGQAPGHREEYELVTARALAALPVLAELALPLLRIGGILVAWKGPLTNADDQVRQGKTAVRMLGGGEVVLRPTGLAALGGHTFALIPKERPTAPRFPRRPGVPARMPLGTR